METNGISLDLEGTRKGSKRGPAIVMAAFAGVAIAGLALGFACGASGSAGDGSVRGAVADDAFAGASAGTENTNSNENSGPAAPANPDEPEAPADGGDAGDEADDPTATPTDEPTATPTATPEGDPCPLCPDDIDDLVQPEPEGDPCPLCPDGIDDLVIVTPVPPVDPCALCDDPEFAAEPAAVAFEYHEAENCEGVTVLSAGLNRAAYIWAEYTEADGSAEHQTPKFWNDSMHVEVNGKYVWFGSWGWIYAYNITFHAMDEDGEEIVAYVNAEYC